MTTQALRKAGGMSANTDRGPSPNVWKHSRHEEAIFDPTVGIYVFDDFVKFGGTVTSNVGTYSGGYKSFENNSCTILPLATAQGGVLRLTTDGTDNTEVNMQSGYSVAGLFAVTAGKIFCFEARIRAAQITAQNIFIGLMEEGLAATDAIFNDSGVLADKDCIGFRILEGDPDGMDAVHNTASGGGISVIQESAQDIVADTWYKFGLNFDGTYLRWFVDGVQKGASTLYSATNVPDGEELCLTVCSKNGAGTARTMDMDWWGLFAEM